MSVAGPNLLFYYGSYTIFFRLPVLKRGSDVYCYYPTTDRKLIEYDFDSVVFHEKSKFQDVCIMHSPQYGNMLILDGDPSKFVILALYVHIILLYLYCHILG